MMVNCEYFNYDNGDCLFEECFPGVVCSDNSCAENPYDCPDGGVGICADDEFDCDALNGGFPNGGCISNEKICDGYGDCFGFSGGGAEDEQGEDCPTLDDAECYNLGGSGDASGGCDEGYTCDCNSNCVLMLKMDLRILILSIMDQISIFVVGHLIMIMVVVVLMTHTLEKKLVGPNTLVHSVGIKVLVKVVY